MMIGWREHSEKGVTDGKKTCNYSVIWLPSWCMKKYVYDLTAEIAHCVCESLNKLGNASIHQAVFEIGLKMEPVFLKPQYVKFNTTGIC